MAKENKLGEGSVFKLVLKIALPCMLAQFINVLYSIVDRIFVGTMPDIGDIALAGIGVCGPIITFISAFGNLVGLGGGPLLGIALGENRKDRAEKILANCFLLLFSVGLVVTGLFLGVKGPMLRAFGAGSDVIFEQANKYFTICVAGSIFSLLSIGMYQFVIAQGYAKIGMTAVIIGAVMNIALDPLFIYVFHLGISGAAYATIISQFCSALFIIIFLFTKSQVKITFKGYDIKIVGKVLKLGITPFLIISLDNVMIIAVNSLLQKYGGAQADQLITINTIVQSFMLLVTMPLGGISGGTQCIISYNYGAGLTKRVTKAQKYIILICTIYTTTLFLIGMFLSPYFVRLFTNDAELNALTCKAIRMCILAIIPLGAQYAIVDGFTAMGQVKISLVTSFFRKIVYFIAVFILPMTAGAKYIFYAESISDILCLTMTLTCFLVLNKKVLSRREEVLHHQNTLTMIENRKEEQD